MYGRLMLGVGWLAVAVFVANGVLGFLGSLGIWVQRTHLTGGLAATLLIVFVHSWFAIYLRGLGRILGQPELDPELARGGRAALTALAAGAVNFLVSAATLADEIPGWLHLVVVVSTLVVQLGALHLEASSVRAGLKALGRVSPPAP